MKIVIDVPEVMYTACSGGNITPLTNMESCLISYVGDGQPLSEILDKISAEINTPNRGTCDYFIVDRIEEIISEYREGVSE